MCDKNIDHRYFNNFIMHVPLPHYGLCMQTKYGNLFGPATILCIVNSVAVAVVVLVRSHGEGWQMRPFAKCPHSG